MSLSRTPGIHPVQNTSTVLIANNSVFEKGRVILETDTNRIKTGDGVSTYTELTYVEWNYEIVEAAGTDTYTGNFSKPFLLAYFPMMRIRVRFTNANTGAATINLNGLGAIDIRKSVSTALSAGDIMAGGIYELCYDGTNLQIPAAVGGTASTPSLTATYVGFGSGANVLTGSADLVWTGTQLTVNGTVSSTGYKISGAAATGTILRGNGTSYVASTNTYPNTTGAGQILYATSANAIGSASDFVRLTTGEVVLGATALIGTELLSLQKNQDAATVLRVNNTTSGTAARSSIFISNTTNTLVLEQLSALYTTSGIRIQNSSVILGNSTAGMNIGTNVAGVLDFWTNNVRRGGFLSTGGLSIVDFVTSPIIQGSTSASGTLTIKATSNATDGDILFYTDNTTERVRITSGGELISGTVFTTPILAGSSGYFIQSRGVNASILAEDTDTSGSTAGGNFVMASNDGAANINGDRLGVIGFAGHNATTLVFGARVIGYATQTWSGAARGSRMTFETCPNSTTTLAVRLSIEQNGSVVIGSSAAALATNATGGFLYIPTCAGTPTGVPVTQAGTVAMVFDTTNNILYIYDGSWLGGTTPGAFT